MSEERRLTCVQSAPSLATLALAALTLAMLCLSVGCSQVSTTYGRSKGAVGRKSLNGFGALRRSYERSGFKTRDISRLSNRVLRSDVIVWTPQSLSSIEDEVTEWFETWLQSGNKTLVYIVPDSGSEFDYWSDTASLAPPRQRMEYRKRAARTVSQRIQWRLNRSALDSNGWFDLEVFKQRIGSKEIGGQWSNEIVDASSREAVSINDDMLYTEFALREYSDDPNRVATAVTGFANDGPTGPGSPGWTMPVTTNPSGAETELTDWLSSGDGNTVVAEITSNDWNNSHIVVVAGGSLLTNYAFTRAFNRRLAQKIIASSTPANKTPQDTVKSTAAFLSSGWSTVSVSNTEPGVPVATGMELLTAWPISLVTMHGLILGLVACLIIFPIFGRPKRVAHNRQSDFGDHLDAVAALMNKAGDEAYARSRINEYRRRMRRETITEISEPELITTRQRVE